MEYHLEKSQMLWLENSFRDKGSVEIDRQQFLDKFNKRLRAVSWIQKLTLEHTRTMLESQAGKHSTAERMLISQLLVDLKTSFSTSTSGIEASRFEKEFGSGDDQRNLAALLSQTGDYNGALTLLHSIPSHRIRQPDLSRIVEIGTLLCARTKKIPEVLGTDDDPMYSAVFECMDVLVLPYNLMAHSLHNRTGFENFIKHSFTWPWIRRRIQAVLKDQPEGPLDYSATTLDFQFRDCFGHSLLHAAVISLGIVHSLEVIRKNFESDQENAIAQVSTAWPSYAPGLTPLACCINFSADKGSLNVLGSSDARSIYDILLQSSGRDLCCGLSIGTARHEFCALAFAIRCRDPIVAKTLVQGSTQQGVDISECCLWVLNWVPDIPLDIRDLLMAHLVIPRSATVSNEDGEGLLEP